MVETKTIVLATATGAFLSFVILWFFFRLHLQGAWASSGPGRKRILAVSLIIYTLFLTTLFPFFAVKLKTGQSFREVFLVSLVFNGFAAVLIVEGFQAVFRAVTWSMAKQVTMGVVAWVMLSALMVFIALRVLVP